MNANVQESMHETSTFAFPLPFQLLTGQGLSLAYVCHMHVCACPTFVPCAKLKRYPHSKAKSIKASI